ncbi:hypothetical protein ACLOJK_020727 [Asimina triloba]
MAFIKVGSGDLVTNPIPTKKKAIDKVDLVVLFKRSNKPYGRIPANMLPDLVGELNLRSFAYQELVQATDNFKEELGRGAFGKVYKGYLPNGSKRSIPVKKLEVQLEEGEREFEAEMKTIATTHHRNSAQLIGFCNEGSNRLLVYEYMSNVSLADILFKAGSRPAWNERAKIALDVAKRIYYLHEECGAHTIHCDIKPQNELMGESWNATISDFGLAKLLMPDQTKTYTGIRGTRGYVAPEWHKSAPITTKTDVYSYGILLLEIVCCRRHVNTQATEEEVGELGKLVGDENVETTVLKKMVKVALWCTLDEAMVRPTMKKVILILEGTIPIPDPPSMASCRNTETAEVPFARDSMRIQTSSAD